MEKHTEEQLLETMRKWSEFIDGQRKFQKIVSVLLIPFILFFFIMMFIASIDIYDDYKDKKNVAQLEPSDSWEHEDIFDDQEHGRHELALKKAQYFLNNSPNSPYANRIMARLYLHLGDVEKAKHYYEKAYELWPCEDYEENLNAINKRIKKNTAHNNSAQ